METAPKICFEFILFGLPKRTNNSATSWRARHAEARKWKSLVGNIVAANAPLRQILKDRGPLEKAKLTLTRHSSISPDFDGLVSSFKHVIDGLIEAGVISNDKMSNIGIPEYRWQMTSPKKGQITVKVEEA